MKRTLLICIMCLVVTLSWALCACSKHQHTFDTSSWQSDDTHHWREATCGHDEEKGEYAEHIYGENGNDCTVCGSHVHNKLTLIEEKAATCTGEGTKAYYKCTCGKMFDKATGGSEV